MRLVQFHIPGTGKRLGLLEGESVIDIACCDCATVLDAVEKAAETGDTLDDVLSSCPRGAAYSVGELDTPPDPAKPHLLLPIDAPEVWGCGVTYLRSAKTRDVDSDQDIYSRVYNSQRPEVFFKATASRCAGPNGQIGIRSDSKLTATEPELALVLGKPDQILGYTICNDVSAWDLERENPLYLPQSKTFLGCCALGPCIATLSTVPDPYNLAISCRIIRRGNTLYEGTAKSSQIKFRLEQLVEFLTRNNPVPPGTVLSTGTGVMVPNEFAHRPGDQVEITIQGIGTLKNSARSLTLSAGG
jgi:2-dehydro-3-deoxy-D-arabinonate dehydratase